MGRPTEPEHVTKIIPEWTKRLLASSVLSSESHFLGIGRTSYTCVAARKGVPKSEDTRIPFSRFGCQERGWSQPQQAAVKPGQLFDGKWWSKTTADEHSGFINGAADCLTWTAHEKGFNATPEQLVEKIDKFYKEHPESADLSVVEVWKKLWAKTPSSAAASQPGETWKNAHWYLDGFWWIDESPDQKLGFIRGYLWCMKTHVTAPTEEYSKPASFYVEKIDTFTKANANSKADREKVASILRRYRDRPVSAPAK